MILPSVRVAVPLSGLLILVIESGSRSTSESLARTSIKISMSSSVVAESFLATGLSFTGFTVTVTVAESVPPFPSEIV